MRFWVIGFVLAGIAAPAFADDVKTADEKFEAASKLREAGKNKEACAMFGEALALNPNAIGTILNVARCAEEDGKVATAIRYFTDARDRSREQNLAPQLAAAEEHLAKLTPRVSHLAIAFAETYPADAKLLVAGRVVDFSVAADVVVDPGPVEVVVSAPGRVPYSTKVTVPEAAHKALSVPKLGYPVTVCRACRTVGKLGVIVGVAAVATGTVVGLIANKRHDDAYNDPSCTTSGSGVHQCPQAQVDKVNDALTLGNVATATFIAGAVVAVGAAALWYFSPEHAPDQESPNKLSIVPIVTPTEAGVGAYVRF